MIKFQSKEIIFLLVLINSVYSSLTVYEGEDCMACIDDTTTYAGVCRSSSVTQSYCCSQDEIDSETDRTCGQSELCSTSIELTNLKPITCPHKKYRCGISEPDIPLY